LFIDCSGFSSILLEKTLGVPFTSYDQWLPNDRAVVMPKQYTDPEKECHPYTKATAMSAGWRFTIPIYTRVGNGYVYSSKFISDEDAEKELREAIGEYEAPAKFLKMKCGYHKEIAVKNVVAVGLSAGFVEPLEATGITFTTAVVKSIADLLNLNKNIWNNQTKDLLNGGFYEMSMEILAFVWAHYHFSTKADTPFWQEIRQQKIEDLPEDVKKILSFYYPIPGRFLFLKPSSMFNNVQWFSMLHAGGAYKDIEIPRRPYETEYIKYFIDVQNYRVEQAKLNFKNHYRYLDDWYNNRLFGENNVR
jgi:tryptophan halogenase